MRDLIIGHPYVIGAFFAVLCGAAVYNTFRAGVAVGEFSILDAVERDSARLASEALGG